MPSNPAIKSQGTVLYYSSGGSPSEFTAVGSVTGMSGLGAGAAPVNDISNLDSTFQEKQPGLPDEGRVNLSLNPNPANTVHQALRTARANQTRLEFRINFVNGSIAQFFGYAMTFEVNVQQGQPVRGSIGIEIDGPVVWS